MTIYQKSSTQTQEAVVFFVGGQIAREMLYTEFEALLDCVAPIHDFAGITLESAYVSMDERLVPRAVVLALIPFDSDGFPELRWDVPLRMLAERGAALGPDLGAGAVRLVMRSQCPLPGYDQVLWDVDASAIDGTLELLYARLRMNRLGLDLPEEEPLQPPPLPLAPGTATLTAESSSMLMTLLQQGKQQLETMREQARRDGAGLQHELSGMREQVRRLETEKQSLQERLAGQQRLFDQHKTALQEELHQQVAQARAAIRTARRAMESERNAALAERDAHMHSELVRIEQERALQEEQLLNLRSELTELRRDKMRLMGAGADKFFAALKEKGVKFVAYQPGAGHITVPMEELQYYLDDTEAYVASKCGVSAEHYRRWLAHYHDPVCQGSAGDGGPCAKPLQKVLKPVEFVSGMHDRCDIHKQFA